MISRHSILLLSSLALWGLIVLPADSAVAAGFEVGENTAEATARGGTGVVNTRSASAVYLNPALLTRSGSQLLVSSNFLTLDVEFERDDFYARPSREQPDQTFDPATNQNGVFPAPSLMGSLEVGPEELTMGAGLFGPPAYGNPCYGVIDDGQCRPNPQGATRGMAVEADMVVVYAGVGAGYQFDLGEDRQLDVGLTAALAYQDTDFSVVVESDPQVSPPWREDPDNEAFVQGQDMRGFAPTGILGVAYSTGALRLAASYRPPMRWNLTGRADVDFPESLRDQEAQLSDDTIHMQTWHAGSLRLGWGLEGGEHPADPHRPRWDLEVNTVWENWSVVDHFRFEFDGVIETRALPPDADGQYPYVELQPIYQRKGYQDTISLRTGFSFGVNSWLTTHTGGFLETPAQPVAYTSADFISWERYAASLGATFHLPAGLEVALGYTFIHSPDRQVTNGEVYNPVPLSQCRGPDFDAGACRDPGTPPGNPQNEGTWRANFQILSAGLSWTY